MKRAFTDATSALALLCPLLIALTALGQSPDSEIGREVAIPKHLQDGEEFTTPLRRLISYGSKLFTAKFTVEEGGGRPLTNGTGARVSDPTSPIGVSQKLRPHRRWWRRPRDGGFCFGAAL
jgi:hypothetical protein